MLKEVLRPVALHAYLSSLVSSDTRSKKHRAEISRIPLKPTALSGPAWILIAGKVGFRAAFCDVF